MTEAFIHIGAEDLRRLLSVPDACAALRRSLEGVAPVSPPRVHHAVASGEVLLMPAWGEEGVGVKLLTTEPRNPALGRPMIQGLYVLFDPEDKRPLATIDGGAITALRTAAVSALATDLLAQPEASTLVMFGAGRQAHAHVEAMASVRPIRSLAVMEPVRERALSLLALADSLGIEARLAGQADVAEAEIVCCCTTSTASVLSGRMLRAGAHVNAMGAYRPDMRELDALVLTRGKVIVEQREAALAEAGDLIQAIAEGAWKASDIAADLSELVRDPGLVSAADITVFKSVGIAGEDLVVASAAYAALGMLSK